MSNRVTVLAPIKLAPGKTEEDLLKASRKFQEEFVNTEPGIIRRELVRKAEGEYMDIVQFRSEEDAQDVIKKEMESPVCRDFFSVMDMSAEDDIMFFQSLETYERKL